MAISSSAMPCIQCGKVKFVDLNLRCSECNALNWERSTTSKSYGLSPINSKKPESEFEEWCDLLDDYKIEKKETYNPTSGMWGMAGSAYVIGPSLVISGSSIYKGGGGAGGLAGFKPITKKSFFKGYSIGSGL